MTFSREYRVTSLAAVFVFAVAVTSPAAGEDFTETVLHACYKTQMGQLRLVSGPDQCLPSEAYTSWSRDSCELPAPTVVGSYAAIGVGSTVAPALEDPNQPGSVVDAGFVSASSDIGEMSLAENGTFSLTLKNVQYSLPLPSALSLEEIEQIDELRGTFIEEGSRLVFTAVIDSEMGVSFEFEAYTTKSREVIFALISLVTEEPDRNNLPLGQTTLIAFVKQ
jgi:hypothetical protein